MAQIAYVNIYTTDLERSVAFFEKTLGLTRNFVDVEHGYASFAAGPIQLGVAVAADDDGQWTGRHTGIGFAVDDLEAEFVRLQALGVEFAAAPERYPWGGFMALVKDPDGNIYYLDEVAATHG